MGSRVFGNRPDCAYYLLLALCGAAVFTALGGIFTYMGYWPEIAFHHYQLPEPLSHDPNQQSGEGQQSSIVNHHLKVSETHIEIYSIVGPLCILIGAIITITIGVLALKYDCEHEPEDAKVAIMRLASEVSLNLSTNGTDTSKYEMIRTTNNGNNAKELREIGPSSSGATTAIASGSRCMDPRGVEVV